MATGTLTIVASIGGTTIQKTITETGDHPNVYGDGQTLIAMPAGKAATAWVFTAANNAACNIAANHGYTNCSMDVFWTDGLRYDCNAVVTGNSLVITGGVGDNFPANAAADVVVCAVEQINTAIDGDAVQLLCINMTQRGSVYFEDANGDSIKQIELLADNPYTYAQSGGEASPMTGDPITVCFASNGSATAGVLTILLLEDATP